MTIRTWKTALLSLLVALSVFFSFELWHGLWLTPSYAAWTGPNGLPPVNQPTLEEVTRPLQVVYHQPVGPADSVAAPASAAYDQALALLKSAQIYSVRSVTDLSVGKDPAMEFDFGTTLTHAELAEWIPSLLHANNYASAERVWLYAPPGARTLAVALQSDTTSVIAVTNLSVASLREAVASEVKRNPWVEVNQADGIYLPSKPITLARQVWQLDTQQPLPLVHSFFVNPQVLTRIDESPTSVLWTDGSRVVVWNRSTHAITYSDPNPGLNNSSHTPLAEMVTYLQNHGGASSATIIRESDVLPSTDGATAYTFRPYVSGYPLLGGAGDYTVDWLNGHIVEYQRPLDTLSTLQNQVSMRTLSAAQIEAIMHRQSPKIPLQSQDIRLGYLLQTQPHGQARLEPVFEVSQNTSVLYDIDAFTGDVLYGGVNG